MKEVVCLEDCFLSIQSELFKTLWLAVKSRPRKSYFVWHANWLIICFIMNDIGTLSLHFIPFIYLFFIHR